MVSVMCRNDVSAAMAAMTMLPVLPGGGFSDLFTNRVFLAGFWGWFTAQTLKVSEREGAGWVRPKWLVSSTACVWVSPSTACSSRPDMCAAQSSSSPLCAMVVSYTPYQTYNLISTLPVLQIFTKRIKKGVWDIRAIVDSGGMPSSHSALCAVSSSRWCKQRQKATVLYQHLWWPTTPHVMALHYQQSQVGLQTLCIRQRVHHPPGRQNSCGAPH